MYKLFCKFLAVLTYLFHTALAAAIPAGITYLYLNDGKNLKPIVVGIIMAVIMLFFFIENIRICGGIRKHFRQISR